MYTKQGYVLMFVFMFCQFGMPRASNDSHMSVKARPWIHTLITHSVVHWNLAPVLFTPFVFSLSYRFAFIVIFKGNIRRISSYTWLFAKKYRLICCPTMRIKAKGAKPEFRRRTLVFK